MGDEDDDELGGSSFDSAASKTSSSSSSQTSSKSLTTDTKFTQTLLFLSCWDNSIYVYDMNYNRCIHHVSDSHDDAISRLALIKIPSSRSFLLISSSWDSSIKIWLTSAISPRSLKRGTTVDQQLKLQFLNELSHDSAVLDFCLTRTHLASICDDGDVLLWQLNTATVDSAARDDSDDESNQFDFKLSGRFARLPEQPSLETTYVYQYSVEHTPETGKITDCRIVEDVPVPTLAVCTSLGFLKIFNLDTAAELFSIRIYVPDLSSTPAKLNRLVYTNDYIITVDSCGFLYFVDLQQQGGIGSKSGAKNSSSSFLSHHIKLTNHSLSSIAIYKELIIACGDAEGSLHFVSLVDI